jgi:hypothetical protein
MQEKLDRRQEKLAERSERAIDAKGRKGITKRESEPSELPSEGRIYIVPPIKISKKYLFKRSEGIRYS